MANYPISYFGNFRVTIVPYGAGLLLCAYSLWRATTVLPRSMRGVRLLLKLMAAACIGVLCTPYMISNTVGLVHLSFAIALLLFEICFSVLLFKWSRHPYILLGFSIQLCGAALSILSQSGRIHLSLIGELLVIIGFAIQLTYFVSHLEPSHVDI